MSSDKVIREELRDIYADSHKEEDYLQANAAYNSIIASGEATTEDYMWYAYLQDVRSRSFINSAIEWYNKAIEHGKEKRDTYYYQAQRQLINLLSRNNRNHENIERHKQLLIDEPDNVESYAALALSYYQAKQYEDAYLTVVAGLKIKYDDMNLLTMAGDVCKALGKYDEACKYWDDAYAVDSSCASCLFSRAFLYDELQDKDQAIDAWKTIITWLKEHGYTKSYDLDMPNQRLNKWLSNG